MMKKIALALALTLGAAAFAAPPASACGPYPEMFSPEEAAIHEVIQTRARRLGELFDAGIAEHDADRAQAWVSYRDAHQRFHIDIVRLRLREGQWRIVSWRPYEHTT